MSRGVVVDASVALSWVLPGEGSGEALGLRGQALEDPSLALLVPPVFWYEVGNTLWVATRRGRLDRGEALEALEALQAFTFEVWSVDPRACLELALELGLSVYDASYLALVLLAGHPLWTLDRLLAQAARARGVQVAP